MAGPPRYPSLLRFFPYLQAAARAFLDAMVPRNRNRIIHHVRQGVSSPTPPNARPRRPPLLPPLPSSLNLAGGFLLWQASAAPSPVVVEGTKPRAAGVRWNAAKERCRLQLNRQAGQLAKAFELLNEEAEGK